MIIVGNTNVGKTSILERFINDTFEENLEPSNVASQRAKIITLDSGEKVKLNIWDTAGQEKYRSVTRMYYGNSDAILLVYDATFRETFDQLSFWIGDISKNLLGGNQISSGNFILALVGNKTDKAEDI